jgi:hypothetical protein
LLRPSKELYAQALKLFKIFEKLVMVFYCNLYASFYEKITYSKNLPVAIFRGPKIGDLDLKNSCRYLL